MILEPIFMVENFIFKLGCSNGEKRVKMRGFRAFIGDDIMKWNRCPVWPNID